METRKQKEVEYYDWHAKKMLESSSRNDAGVDFEGFNPLFLDSYKFCYKWIGDYCSGKRVLDYGCGNGIHAIPIAKMGARVVGIDLSEKSLEIARARAKEDGLEDKVEFLKMDCEKMEFPDSSFDIIFDGGAFSSLDLNQVFPELARVLKPAGFIIGIETLGHNPLTNLKRKINKWRGKRTEWAAGHILKMEDLEMAKKYFNKAEIRFFHLISWIAFPFLSLPGGKILLEFLEKIDKILLGLPFLRKYAFKIVFIFSGPSK